MMCYQAGFQQENTQAMLPQRHQYLKIAGCLRLIVKWFVCDSCYPDNYVNGQKHFLGLLQYKGL